MRKKLTISAPTGGLHPSGGRDAVGKKFTRTELDMMKFPPFQFSVMIGLILSDSWLGFSSNRHRNAHMQFQQSKANSEYL
jgi:hypothetical protein